MGIHTTYAGRLKLSEGLEWWTYLLKQKSSRIEHYNPPEISIFLHGYLGRSQLAVVKMHGHVNLAQDMKLSFAFLEFLTSFLDT